MSIKSLSRAYYVRIARLRTSPIMTLSAIRSANYESRHRVLGLCIKCQCPAGPISKILCETHRKKNVTAMREYRRRVARMLRGLIR